VSTVGNPSVVSGTCLAEIGDVIRRVIDVIPSKTYLPATRATKRIRGLQPPTAFTRDHRETRRQFASCRATPIVLKAHNRVDCFDRTPRKS
jgi:hypothetical protein